MGRPFAWTAGRTLFSWFEQLGAIEETFRQRVSIVAVIRCFPGRAKGGGDRVPSRTEIDNCFPHLATELELIEPELVIPVGRLAIDRFLKARRLDEVIGQSFDRRLGPKRLTVIPLPHPSGRSTWTVRPAHRALLDRALALIGAHPAWRGAFSERQLAR